MPIKDSEKRKEYFKKYRKANRDKIKAQKKTDYQKHRQHRDKKTNTYREKNPWIRFFVNAKQRCENENCPAYKWYGAKGVQFKLTLEEVKKLWFRDKAYKLKNPSLDRRRSDLDYTYDNCRFVDRWLNASRKVDSK
jgi:hypothetical protein